MGEIDTKPIESVQTVISFFGQSNDHKKSSPIKDEQDQEVEKELANIKVQMEAKDTAYKQALVMIDHHQKTIDDLSILLNKSDLQKELHINESREAKTRVNELESALEQTHLDSEKAQESMLDQLMNMETELTVLREAKVESEKLLRQIETMHDLENQVIEKSAQIDSLQMEIKQANMLHIASEEDASNSLLELERAVEDMEAQEKSRLDQAEYINLLETELKQLRMELGRSKEQENEAEIEIAMLKSELHKARAKLAAAEAAETRAQTQKEALYKALQQMGLEAEETNKENRLLKEWMQLADEEQKEVEKGEEGVDEDMGEVEKLRRELEIATTKMGELRTRTEHAMSRAEAAERGKAVLEEKIRIRKEHKERRKAALAALREESIARMEDDDNIKREVAKNYQPLGKVLNMKF